MQLLLDTHIVLWWLADDPALSDKVRAVVADPANLVFVSAASLWEMSIKKALGKLMVPDDIELAIQSSGFHPLDINFSHAQAVEVLPNNHSDPFDRMLIAQASIESLTLVTCDRKIMCYDIKTISCP